jgi:sterol desaturase/sphingolipid hydroxylase (fatty acid hydroxylase superfamily)
MAALVFAFFGLLTAVSLATGFLAERKVQGRRIFSVPLAAGQLRFEATGNLVFLAITVATFTVALKSDVVRFGEPSLARDAGTFFSLMIGFQVFYYFLHRAMHTRALLWMHRWHHRSQVTTALSAQSMSAAEAVAWMLGYVGLPILLSLVAPIGFWGWAAYMAFNVTGNVVGHANVELGGAKAGSRTAALFANPWLYHALHHARWTGHYAFQAALMDRAFGTEFSDWPALFARVRQGRPLASLRERGDETSSA